MIALSEFLFYTQCKYHFLIQKIRPRICLNEQILRGKNEQNISCHRRYSVS